MELMAERALVSEPGPSTSRQSRTPPTSVEAESDRPFDRRRAITIWFILAFNFVATSATLYVGVENGSHFLDHATWAPSAPLILVICAAWQWPDFRDRFRMWVLSMLYVLTASYVVGVVSGFGSQSSFGASLLVFGLGVALTMMLQACGVNVRAVPGNLSQMSRIIAAVVLATSATGVIGFSALFGADGTGGVFWWIVHNVAAALMAVLMGLTIIHGDISTALRQVRWREFVALLVTSCAALILVLRPESLILSWLVLIPAVWAGMRLPTVAAAFLCAILSVAGAIAVGFPGVAGGVRDMGVPHWTLYDGSLTAFTIVVLIMCSMREQREVLIQQVMAERREATDFAGVLNLMLNSMSDAVVIVNVAGEVERYNEQALRLLGRRRLSSNAKDWPELGDFDTQAFLRGESQARVIKAPADLGPQDVTLSVQASPASFKGEAKAILIVRDVTHEQEKLEALVRFAEVAAHDLKTPLTALSGWVQLARISLDDDLPGAVAALEGSERLVARMADQIDNMLAYNVAREGELALEPVHLGDLSQAIAETFPDASIKIDANDAVHADPTLTRQLLENLIGNAVKYAREHQTPAIQVISQREHDWVRVEVSDAGIGVPEGEEERIFGLFSRASTLAGDRRGAGMGLALCRKIVERHGSEISAQRNHLGGLTVVFHLPRAEAWQHGDISDVENRESRQLVATTGAGSERHSGRAK